MNDGDSTLLALPHASPVQEIHEPDLMLRYLMSLLQCKRLNTRLSWISLKPSKTTKFRLVPDNMQGAAGPAARG